MRHEIPHDPLERINAHRLEELEVIARVFGGAPDASDVRAEQVDAEGIHISFQSCEGPVTTRVPFLEPVGDYPSGVRVAFVRLARRARDLLERGDAASGRP